MVISMAKQIYIYEPSDSPDEETGTRINKDSAGDVTDKIVYSFSQQDYTDITPERKTVADVSSNGEWVYVVEGNRCLGREQIELGGDPAWVDITSDTYWAAFKGDGFSTTYNGPCWESTLPAGAVLEILPAYETVEITGIRITVTTTSIGNTSGDVQISNNAIDNTPAEDGYTNASFTDDVPQTFEVTGISGTLTGGTIQVRPIAFTGIFTICSIEILTTETLP